MARPNLWIDPGPSLTGVLYRSKAVTPFGVDDLFQLSANSAESNERNKITGFLTYRTDSFTQYFEGTGRSVNELYQRLIQDRRHTIEVIAPIEVPERRFPGWSMQLLDPLWHPSVNALDAVDELLRSAPPVVEDDEVVLALSGLVDQVSADS